MKNNFLISLLLCILLLSSCQKEEPETYKPRGTLIINIGLFVGVNEVNSNLKSTLGTEGFKVTVFDTKGKEIQVFERASEIPASLELEIGDYYVAAHSNNNLPAAFENPYYYGESEVFSIKAGSSQSVSVNCELANCIVTIIYSEGVKNNFSDFTTTVSSSSGALTFTKEENRAGYFQPLPLNISATLTWMKSDGTPGSKTLTGTIPSPEPKKHYEIHVDASGAMGSALFDIGIDGTPSPVEIVDITDQNNTPVPEVLNSGDLLITEIMYDPTALTDATGEWFEIYNNTLQPVDLQHLVIRKNDTENHIINRQFILASHEFAVLSRKEESVAGIKYVYNTDITLNNTGAVLSVCNYGTDGTDGTVICSVNYGINNFPEASGASLCLDPEKLNITDVVLASSWCVSTTAYNTGDLGTPGAINDNCN